MNWGRKKTSVNSTDREEIPMEEARYLTVPEVARLLRINRGRAYEMANNGTLPGTVRLGRTIRVDRERLIADLMKDRETGTPIPRKGGER
jgi:excisionase family DNA binding protein